jgi:hypothetical protein
MNFEFGRQQSHHLYDQQRLQYLKRLARPVVGTLFVVAFATLVFKSPPPRVEASTVTAAGAAAGESRRAGVEETQLAPHFPRFESGSDQNR